MNSWLTQGAGNGVKIRFARPDGQASVWPRWLLLRCSAGRCALCALVGFSVFGYYYFNYQRHRRSSGSSSPSLPTPPKSTPRRAKCAPDKSSSSTSSPMNCARPATPPTAPRSPRRWAPTARACSRSPCARARSRITRPTAPPSTSAAAWWTPSPTTKGQPLSSYELEPLLITGLSDDANRTKRRLLTYDEIPPNLVQAVSPLRTAASLSTAASTTAA